MRKLPLKSWLALLGMTVSAFIFNTSEFMPIGLLTDIAESFALSEAKVDDFRLCPGGDDFVLTANDFSQQSGLSASAFRNGYAFCRIAGLFRLCGKLLYAHGGALGRGLCSCGILVDSFAVSSALGK